MPKPLSTL